MCINTHKQNMQTYIMSHLMHLITLSWAEASCNARAAVCDAAFLFCITSCQENRYKSWLILFRTYRAYRTFNEGQHLKHNCRTFTSTFARYCTLPKDTRFWGRVDQATLPSVHLLSWMAGRCEMDESEWDELFFAEDIDDGRWDFVSAFFCIWSASCCP